MNHPSNDNPRTQVPPQSAPPVAMTTGPAQMEGQSRGFESPSERSLLERTNEMGDRGMSAIGHRLDHVSDRLRSRAHDFDESKVPLGAKQIESVADRIHSAATYLEQKSPRDTALDVDNAVKKHPYRTAAAAAAVGWIIGRLSRR